MGEVSPNRTASLFRSCLTAVESGRRQPVEAPAREPARVVVQRLGRLTPCRCPTNLCVHLRLTNSWICPGLPALSQPAVGTECLTRRREEAGPPEAFSPSRLRVRHSEFRNRTSRPSRRRVIDRPSHAECLPLSTFVMHTHDGGQMDISAEPMIRCPRMSVDFPSGSAMLALPALGEFPGRP